MGGRGLDWSGSEWGEMVGCCEDANEYPGFKNAGNNQSQLRNYQLLKEDSAAWSQSFLGPDVLLGTLFFVENRHNNRSIWNM